MTYPKTKRPGQCCNTAEPTSEQPTGGFEMNDGIDTTRSDTGQSELPIARLRRLCRELVEAIDEWIESDVPGEQWVIHILPSAPSRQSILLENVTEYPTDFDIAFPVKGRAQS
ncbi:hypothetical protein [Chelativorans sp. M5D2P16]|uniref:hypothetical protein n=1 Tax=Chelativorans sp. M5D2P16 TaxID=3095678 RepID=UPI002ACA4D1B|nr:hypothetical protein [Chelativorans sp. M5D2P16]MDZ5697632.1 hypothetical protein [Chelativorans sp. M5D2P16]